ncbi:MAG: PAS domain S-box protein [Candidatus Aegiribacteria sp.]|nr:PAS domain S-box protein [Candidatus Aegiribacteria sp.]MBD3294526.1 PAS domain S-box protein [Candidatus Fermentibacteria bacterium]
MVSISSNSVLSYISLEELLRDSNQFVFILDRSGKMILVNDFGSVTLGYRPEEIVGMNLFTDFVPSESREQAAEDFRECLRNSEEAVFLQKYPVKCRDGNTVDCAWQNRKVRDEDGIIMCVLVSGHSESGVRGPSDEIARSDSRYRNLVEKSLQGLVIAQDDPVRISFASEPMYEICGYTPEELTGMDQNRIVDLIHPDDRKQFFETFKKRISGEDPPSRSEYRIMHSDGELRWVALYSTLTEYEGEPATQTVFLDITESKQALEALRESEEKYRTVVEKSNDAIIIHRDGIVVFANKKAMELTGYTLKEFLGKSVLDYVSDESRPLIIKNMTDRISGFGAPEVYNIEVVASDGSAIPVELNISQIHYDGHQAYLVIFHDLSERMELEDQLRQAQKMDAVGQLAGGVAHDFNNILQIINGYSELAESTLDKDSPAYTMLKQISEAGERAGDLVKQLLAFSRNQLIVTRVLELNKVISEHLNMLKRVIGEDIVLDFSSSSDSLYVNADPSMMGQILLNICLNARDAMSDGGEIKVVTEKAELDRQFCEAHPSSDPGEYAMISISDNGHGMEKETLSRIFEPFFSTKGITAGTGLGLSTVYGIVTQHDGAITAESQKGMGSTFRVYLPISDSPEEIENIPQEYEMEEGESKTIIITEDDENVRNLTREILMEAGHEVIAAANGEEAVLLITDSPESVDLVILDVVMPVMGGYEAAEKIREIRPDIPLVFCSGYRQDRDSDRVDKFKKNTRFLSKPYSMSDLLNLMGELFTKT